MNGSVKYLLDTNILIGRMSHRPEVLALLSAHGVNTANSGYSVITRIELLGFPAITPVEIVGIERMLAPFMRYALATEVEEQTILLRRSKRVKLPDAIIAATAKVHGLTLLTLDENLAKIAAI